MHIICNKWAGHGHMPRVPFIRPIYFCLGYLPFPSTFLFNTVHRKSLLLFSLPRYCRADYRYYQIGGPLDQQNPYSTTLRAPIHSRNGASTASLFYSANETKAIHETTGNILLQTSCSYIPRGAPTKPPAAASDQGITESSLTLHLGYRASRSTEPVADRRLFPLVSQAIYASAPSPGGQDEDKTHAG